jgi:hypothetical protein
MHARPQIRDILIQKKLLRWCRIAKWHPIDRRSPPARARRNYWRLLKAHPQIAQRLGLNELSVYQ